MSHFQALAQQKLSADEYIAKYNRIAVKKMVEFKIPASITLAQGLLESGNGNSELAKEANNHFGIKCHVGWQGKTYYKDDDEKNECFRSYDDPEASFHDHSLFLTQRPRYAFLFQLDIMDYSAWAHGLSKAGYATNPHYPALLIRIIHRHDLAQYDRMALQSLVAIVPEKVTSIEKLASTPLHPADFEVVGKTDAGRFIHQNNKRKLVFGKQNDQLLLLAAEVEIDSKKLIRYNEMAGNEKLEAGLIIYLQKKARKSSTHDVHIIQNGETLHTISQLYGIRITRLCKMNNISKNQKLLQGTVLKLR